MNTPFPSIEQLRTQLTSREISAVELTEEYFHRIRSTSHQLNCFVSLHEDSALQAAREADSDIARGRDRPLTGIPIAHKDIFCIEGKKTTCCSRMLQSYVAPYSATIVENLENAGAICVGTTNMDEFAMGSSNETSANGPVRNPWNLQHVPGGSSGGSAAAVAARLVAACTGSDTGGSIRQPASFCGVTGFKPTYGRNSRYGMVAFASSLDHPGCLTNSVEDAGRMLSAMAGNDTKDSTSASQEPIGWSSSTRPRRLGYPTRLFADLPQSIARPLEEARHTLEAAGNTIVEIELPHFDVAVSAYYVIACAEASTNLARYDGIRYGHRSKFDGNVEDMYAQSRSEGFGMEVKRRILTGTYVLSVGHYDSYYMKAQKIRRLIRDDYLRAFHQTDVILSPSTPTTAFRLNAMDLDPTDMYKQDQFTVPVNMSGLPAMSVPCGFSDGLPVGLQMIAPHFRESELLELGIDYQNLTDWHQQQPCLPKT
ncbi:MAG: Asp-tRNA(Asn)/Glu-tRNA(Gln) amidotransferase subunit GatA [Gammaproteobacteria bacterium]|nr:Asp-tRNA(Asn)/Glu-tRNA(Gln) amidotransferase subunit GatA [Gammaproteobacteria bacterium]